MSITAGHFSLTAEQRRFKQLISSYPQLQTYWNFETREFNLDSFKQDLGILSHGEQIMGRFFAAVWLGENQFQFDFIEAAKSLDDNHRAVIIEWFNNPFFP